MSVDTTAVFFDLAIAVGTRLEFERRCLREPLIDESTIVRFAAEYLAARWPGEIRPNEPHPELSGKFIDLVGIRPRSEKYDLGLEAKWLKADSGTRQWLKEITVDLFRLQHFKEDVVQDAERILVVAGTSEKIKKEIFEKTVQTGGGTTQAMSYVLPSQISSTYKKFQIRNCDTEIRKWLLGCHEKIGKDINLPSTYDARLAARYSSLTKSDEAIEVIVWRTKRPTGWGSFNPSREW